MDTRRFTPCVHSFGSTAPTLLTTFNAAVLLEKRRDAPKTGQWSREAAPKILRPPSEL
jgi:hypothetical protein